LGRGFTEDEDEIDHDQVMHTQPRTLATQIRWNPKVIGKTILLASIPHTVVGVMGREFQYPTREFQIWKPLTINPADFRTRTGNAHLAIARLKPGVTIEQAQAEINTITARLAEQYPNSNKEWFSVISLREDIGQPARTPLFVLLSAVAGLLLIACANLKITSFAEHSRSQETAVRSALTRRAGGSFASLPSDVPYSRVGA
jgi:putative ABC transport system permease protein